MCNTRVGQRVLQFLDVEQQIRCNRFCVLVDVEKNLALVLKSIGLAHSFREGNACNEKMPLFPEILDDVVVTSVNNTGKYRISEFKYETYPIPAELLKGKKQVRVKFQAKPRKQIGEIYEVRLVKN